MRILNEKIEELKNLKVMTLKPTIIKNINLADLCLNLVNAVDNTNQSFLYRAEDAVNVFCNNLNEIRGDIKERMQENKEIEMTDEDKEAFNSATHCFFYVVKNLGTLIRLKKRQRNTKKFVTIAILQAGIEVVQSKLL